MAFNWNDFEKEKSKQPLHKQTGDTFDPPKKEVQKATKQRNSNTSNSSSNDKHSSTKENTKAATKQIKKPKPTKQESKETKYKDFKAKLGVSLSDLVIDYFDKTIKSLEDLVYELKLKKEEAIEQLKIKD